MEKLKKTQTESEVDLQKLFVKELDKGSSQKLKTLFVKTIKKDL